MSNAFILVVMTMLEGGQPTAAFVNTASAENCERRGEKVRPILTSQKVKILELGCFAGTARFEKFSHKTAKDAPRYAYRVVLKEGRVHVEQAADPANCKDRQAAGDGKKEDSQHCVTSTQKMLSTNAAKP